MWLYAPSPFAPGSVDLTSVSESPAHNLELCCMSNGKPLLRPVSWHGWNKKSWIELLSGTISKPSQSSFLAVASISLSGVSLANLSQSPENKPVPTTLETFGPLRYESCAKPARRRSSLKTSKDSSATSTELAESLPTLPRWGGMLSGVCSPTKAFEPRTEGAELCSLPTDQTSQWPTPRANSKQGADKQRNGAISPNLLTAARDWPTPTAREAKGLPSAQSTFSETLGTAASTWPTPTASMVTGAGTSGREGSANLQTAASAWPTPKANDFKPGQGQQNRNDLGLNAAAMIWDAPSGRQDNPQNCGQVSQNTSGLRHLNPRFVEWLMGFPSGWTRITNIDPSAYAAWEMHFRRLLQHWLGES